MTNTGRTHFKKGHTPWNKGLTKETDEKVKKMYDHPHIREKREPMKEETKEKISVGNKGQKRTLEQRKNMSDGQKRRAPRTPVSDETRQKMREITINKLKKTNGECIPFYNPKACVLFERLNRKLYLNLQHAENGGEFQIIGYFLDAYDRELNLAIEFDEKHHKKGHQIEKDKIRQENIVKTLGCEFIRVTEDDWFCDICEKIEKILE